MFRGFAPRSFGPRVAHMPRNALLPLIFRQPDDANADRPFDPLGRDQALALLEAVLLIADEPLPIRKLLQVTGLNDTRTIRRLLNRLQALYDAEAGAFE